MRTTPSRFNSYIATVDPAFDGRGTDSSATAASDSQRSVLEQRHPAVIETLRLLWGYPELNQYFEKVYRGGDRSVNFEPDAMAELMVLANLHQRICPHRPATPVKELYGSGRWADTWKPARLRR
ncbi:MAG: hypothetical protein ABJA83_05965 [Burkholderiaceae bacterium]